MLSDPACTFNKFFVSYYDKSDFFTTCIAGITLMIELKPVVTHRSKFDVLHKLTSVEG